MVNDMFLEGLRLSQGNASAWSRSVVCLFFSLLLHALALAFVLGRFSTSTVAEPIRHLQVHLSPALDSVTLLNALPPQHPVAAERPTMQFGNRSVRSGILSQPLLLAGPTEGEYILVHGSNKEARESRIEIGLPRNGHIRYMVTRKPQGDKNILDQTWSHDGSRYQFQNRCINESHLSSMAECNSSSSGVLGMINLVPRKFVANSTGSGTMESSLNFDWEKLTASGDSGTQNITPGTQDKLTLLYQTGVLLRVGLGGVVTLAESRGLTTFLIRTVGNESIKLPATGLKEIPSIHIELSSVEVADSTTRITRRADVWFSTEHQYLPVRVIWDNANGEETEWIAQEIAYSGTIDAHTSPTVSNERFRESRIPLGQSIQ
jgi:hypothetical protein